VNRAVLQKVAKYLPRAEKAHELGLSPAAITSMVAGTLNGRRAGFYKDMDDDVSLIVRLARTDDHANPTGISSPEDILNVPLVEHSSSPVYLRELVDLSYEVEPSIRMRYNGKPALTVSADIKTGSQLSPARVQVLVSEYAKEFAARYPGITVTFGGEFETTNRTFTSLGFAFLISVLCIYMILATQFKDYFQPLIILSAIAFAVIGVVFGMFLTRSIFTVGSFMAVVGLAGVAVNDSLILIDFINVRRREGMHMRQAVLDGCSARMRPVLITTVTTIFGLMPLAIGIPHKSPAWAPMATAFVTGLASATILALLIIPVEYELVERFRAYCRKKCGKAEDGGSYDF
ncbi:efflux RND transporter permease subunit, partial [Nitrospirota bacterium]